MAVSPALACCRTTREIFTARPVAVVPVAEAPFSSCRPWDRTGASKCSIVSIFPPTRLLTSPWTLPATSTARLSTVVDLITGTFSDSRQPAIPGPIPRCTTLWAAVTEAYPTAASRWTQPATFMELRNMAAQTPASALSSAVAASSGRSSHNRSTMFSGLRFADQLLVLYQGHLRRHLQVEHHRHAPD